jgi:sarcosine oxidase subunit gamma
MSEFRITRRTALAGRPAVVCAGINIEVLPEGTVFHLLANPASDAMASLRADASSFGLSLRAVAPGQWFVIGEKLLSHAELKALEMRLKPKVDIVDQSHGRVRILVRGPMAVRVLAKGTAVDLALSAFPVGHASTTLIGHIAAHVTRIDQDAFELIVLRSFAESLWDELGLMSQEFGKALH